MASIAQKQLFVRQEIEESGDLERLVLTLKYLPDEELITTLEKKRNKGINKYPIRAVWNSIIAGVVYEHISIESLRRELKRNAESPQMHKLYKEVEKQHKELLNHCEYGLGDRGYDDGKIYSRLWDNYKIKPVIDIRNCWKDGEETKQIPGKWNIVYNYKGQVFCICPGTGKQREMVYQTFRGIKSY